MRIVNVPGEGLLRKSDEEFWKVVKEGVQELIANDYEAYMIRNPQPLYITQALYDSIEDDLIENKYTEKGGTPPYWLKIIPLKVGK